MKNIKFQVPECGECHFEVNEKEAAQKRTFNSYDKPEITVEIEDVDFGTGKVIVESENENSEHGFLTIQGIVEEEDEVKKKKTYDEVYSIRNFNFR